MKKSDLLKFIELYNLSGTIEKVKIVSDGSTLSTGFATENRTMFGTLKYTGIKIDTGEYGIHDTKQLMKMLNVLDEEIESKIVKMDDGRVVGIQFSDKNTESLAMLADLSVIPKPPVGINPGKIDLEVVIDDAFIDRYIKAKNALPDTSTFSFVKNAKTGKVELIMGYSNINTNRIRLEINPVAGKDNPDKMVSFNADELKEIFAKNRGLGGTTVKVNSSGLAHLCFKSAVYEANYYILKVSNI